MNRRTSFCQLLASNFLQVDWHYRTLLSTLIGGVAELPDDCDALVNELLLNFTKQPSEDNLTKFLLASDRISAWFVQSGSVPRIVQINLDAPAVDDHITAPYPSIATLGDLAEFLKLTPTELDWFANLWRFDSTRSTKHRHYRYRILEKRTGGVRLIEMPKPRLKAIQRKIYKNLLSVGTPHSSAHGFVKGRNCLSHASIHSSNQYLFMFDITECFQSIGFAKVKSVFKRIGYSDSVSKQLTALCTHSVRLHRAELNQFNSEQRQRLQERHLPQGAPSSPALANAALERLDIRLTGLAKSLGLNYSRYADDIAMSGNEHRDWRFLESVIASICLDEGVNLNYRKSRIKRAQQQQRLVGIVVNKKVNVERKYYDTLKATLTNCVRYGLTSQNRTHHPNFSAHLLGKIEYVKSLNTHKGLKLKRIYRDIDLSS